LCHNACVKNLLVKCRNAIIRFCYVAILKPVYFRMDPEKVHDGMIAFGASLGRFAFLRALCRLAFGYSNKKLEQKILGMTFVNPVGLAAGFDKNAELTQILPCVDFGFEEVGSITGEPCLGNRKPRLWRLPKSKGLVVYYGLKNDGCLAVAARLEDVAFENRIGTSVAMTNCKENLDTEKAIADYVKAFHAFVLIGDYFTVNVSCPNAEGGQTFMNAQKLDRLLTELDRIPTEKPIFIKLSPDISFADVDLILEVAKKHRVHGIITTNLTKKRDNPKILDQNVPKVGGISGKPVAELANQLLSYIYKKERSRFVLIGCGGIFTAEDAYKKIRLGASLVQLITGMIFEGPQAVSEINRGLVQLLERDGFKNISEAIGVDA